MNLLVADIGGTNARFGYQENNESVIKHIEILSCIDFANIGQAIAHYVSKNSLNIENLSLSIAGPCGDDFVKFTNNHWSFDKRDLLNLFGPEKKIQKKDTFFHNANSAFKKKLWVKIPFDEKTKHIEDRIWGNEVINKGYKIVYEPDASVYHWHGINQDMEPSRCKKIVNILESLNQDFKSNIS